MPFDIDAPVIDILPEDYGIWFVDSMDHPDRYVGKTVHFKCTCPEAAWNGKQILCSRKNSHDMLCR